MKKIIFISFSFLFSFILKAQCWQTITAKQNTVAAIRIDGTLWLWGSNGDGQLGDGTTLGRNVPTQVEGIHTDWESVRTGKTTLAIKKDGSLWGWGSCEYGQLANDRNIDKLDKLVPIRIGTKSDWLMAESSTLISFGIKKNGTLWAWGVYANPNVFFDLFENPPKLEDTFIYQIGNQNDWASVSVGEGFVHAIKSNGTLWAYGNNQFGTLGDGTNKNNEGKFIQIGNDNNWKSISSGGSTVIGIKTGGELYAWGSNVGAAFGNGTKDDISWLNNPTTHTTPTLIGNDKWRSISTSGNQTLAIRDTGTLYVWGINSYYSTDSSINKTIPQQVGAKNTWKNVATSDFVSLPLLNTGSLYSWGFNYSGELGEPQSGGFSFRYSDNSYSIGCDCSTVEPSGVSNQSFCNGEKLSDIKLTGTNIKWYNQPLGGFLYPSTSTLIDGQTYYASQTIDDCESPKRLAVKVSVTTVSEPTGASEQSFCSTNLAPKLLSDLVVMGSNLRWYDTLLGVNVLPNNTPLYTNKTYYVCSVLNGCESTRLGITVKDLIPPPTGESNQIFCSGSTLNDVNTKSVGRKWYTTESGSFSLPESTPLTNNTTYYVSQSYGIQGEGFCESTKRLSINITLTTTPPPTGQITQTLFNKKYLSEIETQGTSLKFYDTAQGGNLLSGTSLLANNKKYYISQTIGNCESFDRLEVLVYLTFTKPPTLGISTVPTNPQIKDVDVIGSNLKWYSSLLDLQSNKNQLLLITYLQKGTTYYVTQTVDGFTSVDPLKIYYDGISANLSLNKFVLKKENINIYPNPSKNFITIKKIETITENFEYKILDLTTRIVKKGIAKFEEKINIENLASGNYVIQIETENGEKLTQKFIKN